MHKQKALSIIILPSLIPAKQRALDTLKRKQISHFLPEWKQQNLGFEMWHPDKMLLLHLKQKAILSLCFMKFKCSGL